MNIQNSVYSQAAMPPRKEYQGQLERICETVAIAREVERHPRYEPIFFIDYSTALLCAK